MDRHRFRPVRIAAGLTAATAVLFVGAVGLEMGHNQLNGEADGQDLGEQFDSALNDSPAGSALDQLDNAPILGDINELAQNTIDKPQDEAEACLRIKDNLRVTDRFEPRYEAVEQVAAQILAAPTDGQVLAIFDAFLDHEGVDFYFNTTQHPLELSAVDWATKGVDASRVNAAKIDQSDPRYSDDLKIYTAGLVLSFGDFSQEFIDQQTDYLILAGNVKDNATATAHEGLVDRGIVVEFDPAPTLEAVKARGIHEITHNFQYAIASELGFSLIKSVVRPYGTNVPSGFRFAEDLGVDPQRIADEHPEYFLPGPEHSFARVYGVTNWLEHGATGNANMLATGGILGADSPSWGSPFHENQLSWLTCFEVAMPGFIEVTVARQLDTGLIHNPDAYVPYFELSTPDAGAVLTT